MTTESPIISIVIPTYNSAGTLGKCLTSITGQSFPDFEVIIVDGLSKDQTLEIASSYNDARIRIFSEKDNGIYDAMNKGMLRARGKWLFFLGSDDEFIDHQVLQDFISFVSATKCDVAYGDVLIDGNAGWANDGDRYDGAFDLKKLLIKNICHQSIFYKKEVIDNYRIMFDTCYPVCADWNFNLKCWSVASFEYMPRVVARFNAGGASTKEVIEDSFGNEVVEKLISYFNITSYSELKKIIPADKMYQLARIKRYAWRLRIDSLAKRVLRHS